MALRPGTRLGPYEILSLLGVGGMGEVYRARDSRLGRDVAIKVLPQHIAATTEDRARFTREAKTISGLNHPNICTLHDIGREHETDYLVMELVSGETLAQRMAQGPLPTSDLLRIGAQIADALEHAHRAGLVHRDLKPSNVMLTQSGAKLMDFGLARPAHLPARGSNDVTATAPERWYDADEPITTRGNAIGTLPYMSPEQLEGKQVDARTDLWALGCVLYELATGERAFGGASSVAITSAILRGEPRKISDLSRVAPPALERLVRACLAKDPADRIQTAHDAKLQLNWMAEGRPLRASIRSWRLVAGIAAIVALVAWGFWSMRGRNVASTGAAKTPILVAEFDGPASDPDLTAAARQLVMAGLDESSRFESVPRDAIKRALAIAGRSESTHVDASLARELAFRNGIKVMVEGRIVRVGKVYSMVLIARDADDGHALQSVTGSAQSENDLIKALADLTRRLRKQLGERPEALVSTRIRWLAATPSFEAYKKYAEAFDLQQMRGDDAASIVLLNEALRIDPDFAEAWALKNFGHGHMGQGDSAKFALSEALKRPGRLTEEGRMFLQGLQDVHNGDYASADRTYRELIRRGYQLSSSYGNHGWVLLEAGRYREALEEYRRAAHASRFGPQQWVLWGEIGLLMMFGEVAEARSEARHLKGTYVDAVELSLEGAAGRWGQADSIAAAVLGDPIRTENAGEAAAEVRAALAVSRGSIREARDLLHRSRSGPGALKDEDADETRLETDVLIDAIAGPSAKPTSVRIDRRQSDYGLAVRGLYAAQRGDRSLARQALRLANARPKAKPLAERGDSALAVLEAYLQGSEGHWAEAATRFSRIAGQGEGPGQIFSPILVRWLAGMAFERSGKRDSAAVYYELALDPRQLFWPRVLQSKMLSSFAHERLFRIYAPSSRQAEAKRHWKIFAADFTNPDPEYARLLRQ